MRDSAIRSWVTVCSDTGLPKATRLLVRTTHLLQRSFGKPDQPHAMMDTARAKTPLRDLKSAPLAEQHVGGGHAHVLEHDFGGAIGHAVEAEHRNRAKHFNARRVHRHQDHRLLAMAIRIVGIGLAHEDADLAARVGRVRRVPFAAVDDVMIAVANDRALDIGGVTGGDRRLGHGEAGADLAREQRLEPAILMLPRAIARQHFHVAGVGRRAIEQFRREMRAAHDLAERRVFEVGQTGAVFALRQEEIPQALLAGFRLQLLDDRIDFPGAELFRLAVVAFLVRIDVTVHERAKAMLQFDDFLALLIEH